MKMYFCDQYFLIYGVIKREIQYNFWLEYVQKMKNFEPDFISVQIFVLDIYANECIFN